MTIPTATITPPVTAAVPVAAQSNGLVIPNGSIDLPHDFVESLKAPGIDTRLEFKRTGSGLYVSSALTLVANQPAQQTEHKTEQHTAPFPPLTLVPQYQSHIEFSRPLHKRMEAVPALAMEHVKTDNHTDPVFFTYNHVKWWHDLAQREYPHLGTEALLEVGLLIFASHYQNPENQKTFERLLRLTLAGSKTFDSSTSEAKLAEYFDNEVKKLTITDARKPNIEYWTSLWPAVLLSPGPNHAAYVLARIREISNSKAMTLISSIAEFGDDLPTLIAELVDEAVADDKKHNRRARRLEQVLAG